jgi:hypothetical protein
MDDADKSMVVGCEKILDAVMHDFNHVCLEREDNGIQALDRREYLGKKMKKVKERADGKLKQLMIECGIVMN